MTTWLDVHAGAADYAVKTIKADGLVANGPDGVMGKFDMTRVADLITKAIPVYTAQGMPAEGRPEARGHRHQRVHRRVDPPLMVSDKFVALTSGQ